VDDAPAGEQRQGSQQNSGTSPAEPRVDICETPTRDKVLSEPGWL
jgi:hypothetical protein